MINKDEEKLGFLNLLIITLSVYVLIALLIDSFVTIPQNIHELLSLIDDGICLIFLYDFTKRLIKSPNKLKFMKWGWIDLVASIPALPFVRYGRVFRLIRLFRVLRAFRSFKVIFHHIFLSRMNGTMSSVAIVSLLVVIFSSISILLVEKDPLSNIKTAEDAVWWAVVTITTVGYGDKFPITTEGRMIGTLLMFVGVGLFGTFTAYVSSWFTAGIIKSNKVEEDHE